VYALLVGLAHVAVFADLFDNRGNHAHGCCCMWSQATRVSATMFHSKPLPQFGYAAFNSKQPVLAALGSFVYPYVPSHHTGTSSQ